MTTNTALEQYRAGLTYIDRLREAGLWDLRGREYGMEQMRAKIEIQQQIYAEFPDANLPMFYLDKAETLQHMEELAEELVEKHSGYKTLTAQEFWREAWSRPHHDRDHPDLLLALIESDCLTEDATRELLEDVWVTVEFPEQNGGSQRWMDAFDMAGWVSDDESERPTEPMVLYRGAIEDHKVGMAWTADPERAAWFAQRLSSGMEPGHVYRRTFQPREILARFAGRNEDEYVCWVADLDEDEIEEVEP
jgi:hypothetical protein